MRILGIDPGTMRTGWGVVEGRGSELVYIASGVICAGRGDLPTRLADIYGGLTEVGRMHAISEVSLEKNFLARNVQSAFRLGEARGVAMAAAADFGAEVREYVPTAVKKSVVGYGRADKRQVQAAVVRLLALDHEPAEDAADALAVALCHVLTGAFVAKVRSAAEGAALAGPGDSVNRGRIMRRRIARRR